MARNDLKNVTPEGPVFYNYRGAALREGDYTAMRELEAVLGKPVPHLYDEGEVGFWPKVEYEDIHDPYEQAHPWPWRPYMTHYPWQGQLAPWDYAFITREARVTGISLFEAALSDVPTPLFRLACLSRLLLKGNQITQLPAEISKMPALSILAVGRGINTLPETLGSSQSLEFLDLLNTSVACLPQSLIGCTALKRILVNNRFSEEDQVLLALEKRGVHVEILFDSNNPPTREEMVKWVLSFDQRHPGWTRKSLELFLEVQPWIRIDATLDEMLRDRLIQPAEGR